MTNAFIPQNPDRVRNDPLGPITLNQAHANVEFIDSIVRVEHFSDGQHNAQEIPWVLGHVSSGTTGYLFDTAYGGGTIARPATGECTVSVASGVIGVSQVEETLVEVPAASVIANVSDADVLNKPHTITCEMVSQTSIKTRVRRLTSTLGSPGNSWESVAREFDIAVHAQKADVDPTALSSHSLKISRRDYLTEEATDWNALVGNQGLVRKNILAEHDSAGDHNVNRVAKAEGWFIPIAGPAYQISVSQGVDSVTRISTGVVEVAVVSGFGSTNLMACFPVGQPASTDELVIVNGRPYTGSKFRFYIYVMIDEAGVYRWERADRPFFAAMFGEP